jgi:hypothetical protein
VKPTLFQCFEFRCITGGPLIANVPTKSESGLARKHRLRLSAQKSLPQFSRPIIGSAWLKKVSEKERRIILICLAP